MIIHFNKNMTLNSIFISTERFTSLVIRYKSKVRSSFISPKMAIHEDSVARSDIQNAIGLGIEKKGTLRPSNVE